MKKIEKKRKREEEKAVGNRGDKKKKGEHIKYNFSSIDINVHITNKELT